MDEGKVYARTTDVCNCILQEDGTVTLIIKEWRIPVPKNPEGLWLKSYADDDGFINFPPFTKKFLPMGMEYCLLVDLITLRAERKIVYLLNEDIKASVSMADRFPRNYLILEVFKTPEYLIANE